ncbi:MAG: hypothetical protein ACRDRJ_37375 [Streptosporangiaceae bacterium]
MHPYLTQRVSQEHVSDLHRAADQSRLAARTAGHRAGARRPAGIAPAAIRNRAGWTLVHLGLRLVSGSADG